MRGAHSIARAFTFCYKEGGKCEGEGGGEKREEKIREQRCWRRRRRRRRRRRKKIKGKKHAIEGNCFPQVLFFKFMRCSKDPTRSVK